MINATASFSSISVDDFAAARAFYVDKLGLKVTDDKMGIDLELPGGSRMFVYEKPDHEPAAFTVLNFIVPSIDDAVADLEADGIVFERYELGEGMQQDDKGVLRGLAASMGPDIAWFKDPAGNVLAVLQTA